MPDGPQITPIPNEAWFQTDVTAKTSVPAPAAGKARPGAQDPLAAGLPLLRVTVAVTTRRRPIMLAAALRSLAAMTLPEHCQLRFVVIENDETPRMAQVVADHAALFPEGGPRHVLEVEPGIPFARNRAVREAMAEGSDLLAFLDDDEEAAPDWIARLIAARRASGALLIGGPVRIKAARPDLGRRARLFHRALSQRFRRNERRGARRGGLHGTPGVTIVTSNWLGDLRLFSDHGLRFDEALRVSGGSDAKLSAEVKQLGLPTAWAREALVYETLPPERLSYRYQYERSRDQTIAHYHRKRARGAPIGALTLALVPLKILALLLLAALLPAGGRSICALARTHGWLAGSLAAPLGRHSSLYVVTTGE